MKFVSFAVLCGAAFATIPVSGLQLATGKVLDVSQLTDAKVIAVLAPYAQRNLSPAEAAEAAEVLAKSLRDAGAFAAKVYVREDVATGVIRLEVIEGRLAQDGVVLTANPRRVDPQRVRDQLAAAFAPGRVLTARAVERAVLLTNDLPGIATTINALQPAAEVGEARLEVTPVDAAALSGSAFLDNFGNRDTGRYRAGAVLKLNSPMGQGDQVTIGANVSDRGTTYADLDATLPLGNHGLRFGVSGSYQDYRTDEPMHYRGRSSDAGLYLRYPFIRSRTVNLYGEAQWGWSGMKDRNDLSIVSDRQLRVGSFRLHGDYSDGWGGGGVTTGQLEVYSGNLTLSSYGSNDVLDAVTARAAGSFSRTTWRLSRMQHLHGGWQTLVEISGQFASKNLDSSQSLSFGGPYYFAGYQSGELVGNDGEMLHADLRYTVPGNVGGGRQQWSVFYDLGGIRTHAVDIIGNIVVSGVVERSYTVQSAGIGFSQQWARWTIQGALGWRLANEVPAGLLADPGGSHANFWLHVTHNF